MSAVRTILIVGSGGSSAEKLRRHLVRARLPLCRALHAGSLEAAEAGLSRYPVDAVVTDIVLPDAGGPEVVRRLRGLCPEIPLLVVGNSPLLLSGRMTDLFRPLADAVYYLDGMGEGELAGLREALTRGAGQRERCGSRRKEPAA